MRIRKLCFFKLSMSLGQLEDLRKVTYFWTSVPMLSSNLIIIHVKRGFFVEVKKMKAMSCHPPSLMLFSRNEDKWIYSFKALVWVKQLKAHLHAGCPSSIPIHTRSPKISGSNY